MNYDKVLSRRIKDVPPSGIRNFFDVVSTMKDAISLGGGEPDFTSQWTVNDAAIYSLRQGRTHYTANAGLIELREAACDYLEERFGVRYDPKTEIFMTVGASEGIDLALRALVEPDDEVLMPDPSYVSYSPGVIFAGGVPRAVVTREEDEFRLTPEALREAITPRTKALMLNSPSNPTGAVWNRAQLTALAKLAVKYQFYIISDEIYEKLVYDGQKHVSIATLGRRIFEQTIVISGFSKAYAMTGWRLGYAAGPRPVIAAMSAFQSHATGNPNSIAQYAGLAALNGDQTCVEEMRKSFEKRRNLMYSCLTQIPLVTPFKPQGAFYILLDIRETFGHSFNGAVIHNSLDFAELLLKNARVSVVPGDSFGAPGYCRLSYAIGEERILEAIRRIGNFVDHLSEMKRSA